MPHYLTNGMKKFSENPSSIYSSIIEQMFYFSYNFIVKKKKLPQKRELKKVSSFKLDRPVDQHARMRQPAAESV